MAVPQALGARPRRTRGAQRRALCLNFARGRGSGVGPSVGDDTATTQPVFTSASSPGRLDCLLLFFSFTKIYKLRLVQREWSEAKNMSQVLAGFRSERSPSA